MEREIIHTLQGRCLGGGGTSKFVEKHIYFKRGGGRVRWLQMVEIGV